MKNIFNSAIEACFIYRNGYINTLNQNRRETLIGKNLFYRLKRILIITIKEFKVLVKSNPDLVISNKTLALINSKNNKNALSFIKSDEVVFYKFTVLGNSIPDCQQYYLKIKFFYSLLFWFIIPFLVLSNKNRLSLIQLHKSFGVKVLFKKILKKHKPKKILFTNDHIPEMRSFLLAAKDMGIETIYIQHGSVSKYFPPLIFDLALLESQYSFDTYSKIGIPKETKIELIGMPKLDKTIDRIKKRKKLKVIGVAINQNDEIERIKEVMNALLKENYIVFFRKHPLDFRIFNFAKDKTVIDGNRYDVLDFIQEIDFLIASDSSIHVEANSLQCRSLYYPLHSNECKKDYYEFVKNGFIDEVKSPSMLISYLKLFDYSSFNFFSKELNYYNEALGSDFYGKSIEKSLIHLKLNQN